MEKLLAAPAPKDGETESSAKPKHGAVTQHGFKNEPMRDFARADCREAMARAVEGVRGRFGEEYAVVIDGQGVATSKKLVSVNPAKPEEVVGRVGSATVEDAEAALLAARRAQPGWAAKPAGERAKYLLDVAGAMRERRDELSAWMVWEVGKTWREADADVCEAIDFCEYYAREMVRMSEPKRLGRLPGELNQLLYQPRGVAAVIAPWNFPLAILTGMAMAAAVTGNTVIMKPAEQSSVIAAKLMEICEKVGFPKGVLGFLPGPGEEVGKFLVESPEVNIVAFTGSMDVGLQILRRAGDTPADQHHVKKVVCEMGGKNAIIVDADADLDEAVQGVVQSAFGFQGQKCSACSRVIVHESCYEEFTERLVGATKSLLLGAPHEPGTKIGPVIDEEAKAKIESYIEIGKQEGNLLVHCETPGEGYFVGPTVIADIDVEDRLAQEEVFGPVLAVMKASSFEDALGMANCTRFALTGGIYSRSPYNIDAARRSFNVGNLYINRGCTGALVYRNPFGGHKLSGAGTKAGGPDYLRQFMEPRTIVENTMRRGFAPED
jgi:RHH-type proline utilization regulon transcriptional repressor/proline dehydrogenase/delta 1-pyrroline-5-carboxylate dehydrogenase